MTLTEKHRPSRLSAIVGQSATVAALQGLIGRGMTSRAVYIIGPSGHGKTCFGRCLCNELGIDAECITQLVGAQCDADFVKRTMQELQESSLFDTGSGWKAVLVDEAHAMSRQAVQLWLGLLENLPKRRLIVFTSNASLECYGEFSGALFSRCNVFHLDLDVEAAAQHVAKIASDEGLNGQPLAAYRALLAECDGNIRAALQRVEQGGMLKCQNTRITGLPQAALGTSRVSALNAADLTTSVSKVADQCISSPSMKSHSSALESEIAAEIERGRKFCAGSRKWSAHKDRLAELEAQR